MINQQIDLRTAKGLVIANTKCQIKRVTKMAYLVKSQSNPLKKYIVSNVMGKWNCECPDYTYRKVTCKHLIAVQLHLEQQSNKIARKKAQNKTNDIH